MKNINHDIETIKAILKEHGHVKEYADIKPLKKKSVPTGDTLFTSFECVNHCSSQQSGTHEAELKK